MLSDAFLKERNIYELKTISEYLKSSFNDVPKTKNILIKGSICDARDPHLLKQSVGYYFFKLVQDNISLNCLISYNYFEVIENIYADRDKEFILYGSLSYYDKGNYVSFFVSDATEFGKSQKEKEYEKILKLVVQNDWLSKHRPIPPFVKTVGVVTASGHAAEKDIYTIIKKNNPFCEIIYYHSLVQGTNAPQDIADKIKQANAEGKCDVLIIGRGGGSSQDLEAFNSLPVVEAVATSRIVTISAVGHATDVVIIDKVADHSAKTPSDAAGMVAVSLINFLEAKLEQIIFSLSSKINRILNINQTKLNDSYQRLILNSPIQKVMHMTKDYNLKFNMLNSLINNKLNIVNNRYLLTSSKLISPLLLIQKKQQIILQTKLNLDSHIKNYLQNKDLQINDYKNQLQNRSPKRILEMGYAKLQTLIGRDIKSVKEVMINDQYKLRLSDGSLNVKVTDITKEV